MSKVIMQFVVIYFFGLWIYFSEGKDWNCPTISEVYVRLGGAAHFHFNVSKNLQRSLVLNFVSSDDKGLAVIRYGSDGNISTNQRHDFAITADSRGIVDIILSNVTEDRSGIYRMTVINGTIACRCLYILGVPTKPTVSVSANPSLGGCVTLTCTSTSTTSPNNHSLSLVYAWTINKRRNPSSPRFYYSSNRQTIILFNILKTDASKQFKCVAAEDISEGYSSTNSDTMSINLKINKRDERSCDFGTVVGLSVAVATLAIYGAVITSLYFLNIKRRNTSPDSQPTVENTPTPKTSVIRSGNWGNGRGDTRNTTEGVKEENRGDYFNQYMDLENYPGDDGRIYETIQNK